MKPELLHERYQRVLLIILAICLGMAARIWQVSVLEHDKRIEMAQKPQRRVVMEKPLRGTIRDRFNQALAINKIQYNASIHYAQIQEIPGRARRRAHIDALASVVATKLDLKKEDVLDFIHSKAALFHNVPVVLKENITEEQYYQLKALEKDLHGLVAERASKRVYPLGKVASTLIGNMGAISRDEYNRFCQEKQEIKELLDNPDLAQIDRELAEARLKELTEIAYTINDDVGKTGIEQQFEESLRGTIGRKHVETDTKGTYLRVLPESTEAQSGDRVLLSISAELQEFAEGLLARNERIRDGKSREFSSAENSYKTLPSPWIKGGAIVAMEPNTGQILAMASYPRFDPNDFIKVAGSRQAQRWLEGADLVEKIWNEEVPLQREEFEPKKRTFTDTSLILDWPRYLEQIFPAEHSVKTFVSGVHTVRQALGILTSEETHLDDPNDEAMALDLLNLVVDPERISPELASAIGNQSLCLYKSASAALGRVERELKGRLRKTYHDVDFAAWREAEGKTFLKACRAKEKANHTYEKPYMEHFEQKEAELFDAFWQERRRPILQLLLQERTTCRDPSFKPYLEGIERMQAEGSIALTTLKTACKGLKAQMLLSYIDSLRSFTALTFPLRGNYRQLRDFGGPYDGRSLAAAFYPASGFGYLRAHTYRQACVQGSIFKLVTAMAALKNRPARNINPLTIIDSKGRVPGKKNEWIAGYRLDGTPIYQQHNGGRLLLTVKKDVGPIDVMGALAVSSNPYFALLAAEVLKDPQELNEMAGLCGYGERTGIELPGEFAGKLPQDLAVNKTGLYCYASGQHSLVATPLQSAVLLSAIANGGKVLKPQIVSVVAAPGKKDCLLQERRTEVLRDLALAPAVQGTLLQGMHQTLHSTIGTAKVSGLRNYQQDPDAVLAAKQMQHYLVAKTSGAESMETVGLGRQATAKYTHLWFGAIGYEKPVYGPGSPEEQLARGKPELVVIVYLKYGDSGRESMPLAAQMLKKWREIKAAKGLASV